MFIFPIKSEPQIYNFWYPASKILIIISNKYNIYSDIIYIIANIYIIWLHIIKLIDNNCIIYRYIINHIAITHIIYTNITELIVEFSSSTDTNLLLCEKTITPISVEINPMIIII